MTQVAPDDVRERSAALAWALTPVIEAHLAAEPQPQPIVIRVDETVMAAAKGVADALTRFDQSRYTRAEISARAALVRAARELRKILKEHRRA